MKNLYLVRHGQTEYNIKQLYQGQCDSPLTQQGIDMAIKTGKYLKDHHIKYDYCCSSKLKRASDTLRYITSNAQQFDQYEGLNERYFGSLEGQPWVMPVEIREQEYLKHNVESNEDVAKRVYQSLRAIMQEHDNCLVVSHGASIKNFCKKVQDCPIDSVIPNCHVLHFTYHDNHFNFVELIDTQ